MGPLLAGWVAGAAPAALPAQQAPEDVDRELVDLLCEDPAWVDRTFRDILATSWGEPPRGGPSRPAARPPCLDACARRGPRHDGARHAQWRPGTEGRERAPPVA